MKFLDFFVYIIIAISYNLFIHQISAILYKDLSFEDKFNNSLILLFISGILGIIIAKLILKKEQNYKESPVSIGFCIGGIILILTTIIVNWENMNDEIKLCISCFTFGTIIWYFYNYYNKKSNNIIIKNNKNK